MYIVNATLTHHTNDQNCVSVDVVKQIPTFFLDENVQGIVNDKHAEEIAKQIICPIDLDYESFTISVTVVKK